MSARLDEATVFRLEQVRSITGIETGGILTPSALAQVFLHPAGLFKGAPESARRVVFLNKEDLVEEDTRAVELADILLADPMKKIDRVILGSVREGVYQIFSNPS
jgi:probable selenium-dependent hydroxylase accessory protein YqeC